MGLASKMAAAGGAAYVSNQGQGPPPPNQGPGYPGQQGGGYGGGQAPYPGGAGGYPPQQGGQRPPYPGQGGGYQPYQPGAQGPGPSQGGYQQQQYGQQGGYQQPHGQHQQGGAGAIGDPGAYMQILQKAMSDRGLNPSMFPQLNLNAIASAAPRLVGELKAEWNVPLEVIPDIAMLGLYDVIIFIGERIHDLALILNRAATAATKFDADGISLRFMNRQNVTASQLDGIRNPAQIEALIGGQNGQAGSIQFAGLTPLGTELKSQVLDSMVIPSTRNRSLPKPVLVIIITDGQPAGESRDTLRNSINSVIMDAERAYGRGARPVSFQIAQVGNDEAARKFLAELDDDPTVGDFVDYEFLKVTGQTMTPDIWLMKLLLGGISSEYDLKDEKKGASGRPAQPAYGGQQYGQQPGQQYGQPSGYGQQYPSQGPPSGYGGQGQQQGYNRPPPSYPPQSNQGYPPQGGYYQGGSAPPPPPKW